MSLLANPVPASVPAPKKRRWLRRLLWCAGILLLLAAVGIAVLASGALDGWLRGEIVRQIEQRTTARAELREFHFDLFRLRAELRDFTIRSSEPEGTPPLFHAEYLLVDARVDSVFRRKFSLDEVLVRKPVVHVRLEGDGRSNIPQPRVKSAPRAPKPFAEQLFAVVVRRLNLEDGDLHINQTRIPLVAEGGEFDFALAYTTEKDVPRYDARLDWRRVALAARRYIPFSSDVHVEFSLGGSFFDVKKFSWRLPLSEFRGSVRVDNFSKPAWAYRFDGNLSLLDLKQLMRKPNSPGGDVRFSGTGTYAAGELALSARYDAKSISMPYTYFHTPQIDSRGSVRVAGRKLEIPDFAAELLGGTVRGRVTMDFSGLKFRADTHAEGIDLAGLLSAVDNPGLPLNELHWDGRVAIDSVTEWHEDFKDIRTRGRTVWTPDGDIAAGAQPARAALNFDYDRARGTVILNRSEIHLPVSSLEMDGYLGGDNSDLNVVFRTQNLLQWDDFINRLRGATAEERRISGEAEWRGKVLGRLAGPTFAGHVKGRRAAYGGFYWDELEGDMRYSPQRLHLENFTARRGPSRAALKLDMQLDDWSFEPESEWDLDVNLVRAPTDQLQNLFGWDYDARGLLTARLRGHGTRADPVLEGPFMVEQLEAYGWKFDRGSGQFALRKDEVRISQAEVQRGAGRINGSFSFRLDDDTLALEANGKSLAIADFEQLQTGKLRLAGTLGFALKAAGLAESPRADGTAEIVGLRVGDDDIGRLRAKLTSTGRHVMAELAAQLTQGSLGGKLSLELRGDYPVEADLDVKQIDLNPFTRALVPVELSGQGEMSGRLLMKGPLARPQDMEIDADLSQLLLDYDNIKLENDGPVQLTYRRTEVRIQRARIHGPDTDFSISGYARFVEPRPLSLRLAGSIDLRALSTFVPNLDARGVAQVNAGVEGTLASPRITGSVRLDNVGATYGDFPLGLSRVSGNLVFDQNRLLFENLKAEAGGGDLVLGGTVSYGDGPARYDLSVQTRRVRIRYPTGMSWLAGGALSLRGTREGALLSGRIIVERLLLSDEFSITSLISSRGGGVTAPVTTSSFLRNLQFDIRAISSANAALEWTGARIESQADLHLRGTWEHPIFLGSIVLSNGEMTFRGSRYTITRGDVNFSDPRRVDPVLNIEAVTTIQQYEVTLNFNGPASKLNLSYRSDPPLPQGDIIALLALGRTADEGRLRTGASGTDSDAGVVLSEAISSQIGGRIERLFGISRFKVDPFLSGTATNDNPSARITIEQQITRDLTVTYSTDVTTAQQQIIQIEYTVDRNRSVVFLRDKNGTFALEVKFKKRFK